MLRAHGHLAQEYHPTVMRMFGPKLSALLPHWKPPVDGEAAAATPPFPAYTVPGLELRRLLSEARGGRTANGCFCNRFCNPCTPVRDHET